MGNKKNENIEDKYTYRIEWSDEDGAYIARCLEFPGLGAHGNSQEEAFNEIRFVVQEALSWLKEENKVVPEPLGKRKFKGNLTLRVPSEVHRQLAIKSAEEGVSLNQYILSKIS